MRSRGLFLILIVVFSVFGTGTVSAQAEGPIYIVESGDTLYSIAQRFGATVDTLVEMNNIVNPSLLAPGDELLIPGFEGVSGVLITRDLHYGETLGILSAGDPAARETLIQLNRVLNPDRLYIGQPMITLQQDESTVLTPERILPAAGESRLELAARNGVNPWELGVLDESNPLGWVIPGVPASNLANLVELSVFPVDVGAIEVDPERAVQGRPLKIEVQSSAAMRITGEIGDQAIVFHPTVDGYVALQGISALAEPGLYDLKLSFFRPEEQESYLAFSQPLRVASGDYGFDPILFVPEETIDPAKTGPEDAMISELTAQISTQKFWEGEFAMPSTIIDVYPSIFGSRRNYNNTGYTRYHTGLDFYGGTGTPITAPAAGMVVFASSTDVRGNMTFIDHGWGVFTAYLHQSEIDVAIGDMVEKDQVIGLVGGTGRVTGPHLHYEVWVGGVPVDPLVWSSKSYP
jgi:murein DD-endopeptidase MepM/ murein hydrolase activator NlpD